MSESEEKHLRLRVKQLIRGSLNGRRIRQSLPQPYIPRTGTQISWKAQGWELECRVVPQSQGEGCCDCRETDPGDVRAETLASLLQNDGIGS